MHKEIISAKTLLADSGLTILDAARLVKNILDSYKKSDSTTPIQFCSKLIETGKRNMRDSEMSITQGFSMYLEGKSHLRKDSLRDIRYLGTRLINSNKKLAKKNFSELSKTDCENWLLQTFTTPSQFNKARATLHALFEYAIRNEWCVKNPVKLVEKRKIVEKEIKPLTIKEVKTLLKSTAKYSKDCTAAVALLTLAGIRPREVRKLEWSDIDLEENTITIRSQCSKTGGTRQVEICPALKNLLRKMASNYRQICPPNWFYKWKQIRDLAGFKGSWIQDVLRHTYASYYAKRYHDLPRLQLNMGHRDISLLRSRYINMNGISKVESKIFFN